MNTPLRRRTFCVLAAAAVASREKLLQADDRESAAADPVQPWRSGVKTGPVSNVAGRHTMHTYYLCNPESPDGRRVVFFASTDPAGHVGNVCMQERAIGSETVLAENVHTEDAHRLALQQWVSGGRRIAYHEVVDSRWRVVVVDVETGVKTIAAVDRQLGFGRSDSDLLPLYGCHWNPGEHRGLELYNAETGEMHTAVEIAAVEAKYGSWLQQQFAGKRTSIAFPALSPDHQRVFFKMAAGNGGHNYMSKGASVRQGLVCYDLAHKRFTWMRPTWGHPAWHPDSRRIIEMGNVLFNTDSGSATRIPDVPVLRGQHLAISPQGDAWVSDGLTESMGGPAGEWGVQVADLRGGQSVLVHRFMNNRGARSWRVSHPHPVFSADGKRIYYNVSSGPWTQLYVAERMV